MPLFELGQVAQETLGPPALAFAVANKRNAPRLESMDWSLLQKPLLHLAGRVSIFAAPQYDVEGVDPADLADYLRWHGIRAHPVMSPEDDHATGATLVSAASGQRATLIVMGAYTHSRLRQSFLGGVTRHLLAHAPVPLLMSH